MRRPIVFFSILTVAVLVSQSPPMQEPGIASTHSGSQVGELVGQGTRDGELCTFASPVGLTVEFVEGSPGTNIRAHVRDDCSMVVTAVTSSSEASAGGGQDEGPLSSPGGAR